MKLRKYFLTIACLSGSICAMNPNEIENRKPYTSPDWTPKEWYYYLMASSNVLSMEDGPFKEYTLKQISLISGHSPSLPPKNSSDKIIRQDSDHEDAYGFIGGIHPNDEKSGDESSDDQMYGSIYLH